MKNFIDTYFDLYGCGYQPIYINKNLNNLEFKEIIQRRKRFK